MSIEVRGHVVLSYRHAGPRLAGRLVLPGDPADEPSDYDPERPLGPGKVRVFDERGTRAKWRKRKDFGKVHFIETQPAAWVLRRSIVGRAFEAIPSSEVTLAPVEVCDDEGVIDDDWILLDVRALFPIDRDAAVATYANPSNPHASNLLEVERFAWRPEREARYAMFRTAECPGVIFARSDLFKRLAAVLGKLVVGVEPPYAPEEYTGGAPVFTSTWTPDPFGVLPEIPSSPDEARRAATAFWDAYAGHVARARVLESPHYAYWLAKVVDGAPRDDTRHAACAIPFYALMYARDVDRGATDETRRSVKQHEATALVYEMLFEGRKLGDEPGGPPAPQVETVLHEPVSHFAEKDTRKGKRRPTHVPFNSELQGDLAILLDKGLARLHRAATDSPDVLVTAICQLVDDQRARKAKLTKGALAEIAIVWGEQLVRVLGWQWATVVYDDDSKAIGVISPDRSLAHFPLRFLEGVTARKADNTVQLLYNMLRAGRTPSGKPWGYLAVS